MADQKQATGLSDLKSTAVQASDTQDSGPKETSTTEGLDLDIEKAGEAVHTAAPAPQVQILVPAGSPGPGLAVETDEKKLGFFPKLWQFLKAQLKKPVLFWNKTDKRTMLTASSCFVTVMMLCAMISLAIVTVHGKFSFLFSTYESLHTAMAKHLTYLSPTGSRLDASSGVTRAVESFHDSASSLYTVTVDQRDQSATYLSSDDPQTLTVTPTMIDMTAIQS